MGEPAEKTKRPANSAFKQQRLAAWQPILTAGTVLPTFFVIGILFIPVGIGLLFFSQNVNEKIIEYTDCMKKGANGTHCKDVISQNDSRLDCICEDIPFEITVDFKGKVFIYYALTNFYQNHRRYVKSRDDAQLLGKTDQDPDESCKPFQKAEGGKIILPCGAIANSMFSDDIELYKITDKKEDAIPLLRTGIAWESDKHYKFKNPSWFNDTKERDKYASPIGWRKQLWELDPLEASNNGLENEDLIVWMRTAALPNFRKLYRIVDHDTTKPMGIKYGLPIGNYSLKINYSFPVKSFGGTKSVVISTTSLLGGKNNFLGIAYIIVGSVCLVLGIVFLFIHINYGKSTWEMTHVDARTPY